MLMQSAIAGFVLAFFLQAQRSQIVSFKGASQGYLFALNVSALICGISYYALLIYWGISYGWVAPFVLLVVNLVLVGTLVAWTARVAHVSIIAMAGFVGAPLSALWLYLTLAPQ